MTTLTVVVQYRSGELFEKSYTGFIFDVLLLKIFAEFRSSNYKQIKTLTISQK